MPTPASNFFSSPDLLAATVSVGGMEREEGESALSARARLGEETRPLSLSRAPTRPTSTAPHGHTPLPANTPSSLTITPAHVGAANENLGHRPPPRHLGHARRDLVAVSQLVQLHHGRRDGQGLEQSLHFGAVL